jgi:hypothetical protein
LTFYQSDCDALNELPEDESFAISNAELFTSLEAHMNTLEYLDIFRDSVADGPGIPASEVSCFGLLRGFERLRILCIQPETLLGGLLDEPPAPFRLKDTPPTSLETLLSYGPLADVFCSNIESQFRELLESGDFPKLRFIIFEDSLYFVPDSGRLESPHFEVKALCEKAKIEFHERECAQLSIGGKNHPWFKNVNQVRHLKKNIGAKCS